MALEKAIENEEASIASIVEIAERNKTVQNVRGIWDGLSIGDKRRILRVCIDKIIVTDDAVDIHYLL